MSHVAPTNAAVSCQTGEFEFTAFYSRLAVTYSPRQQHHQTTRLQPQHLSESEPHLDWLYSPHWQPS